MRICNKTIGFIYKRVKIFLVTMGPRLEINHLMFHIIDLTDINEGTYKFHKCGDKKDKTEKP